MPTLSAKLSTEEFTLFLIMLADDLLGQAIFLLLDYDQYVMVTLVPKDDGEHVRARFVLKAIKHNLNVSGYSEKYKLPAIG